MNAGDVSYCDTKEEYQEDLSSSSLTSSYNAKTALIPSYTNRITWIFCHAR